MNKVAVGEPAAGSYPFKDNYEVVFFGFKVDAYEFFIKFLGMTLNLQVYFIFCEYLCGYLNILKFYRISIFGL